MLCGESWQYEGLCQSSPSPTPPWPHDGERRARAERGWREERKPPASGERREGRRRHSRRFSPNQPTRAGARCCTHKARLWHCAVSTCVHAGGGGCVCAHTCVLVSCTGSGVEMFNHGNRVSVSRSLHSNGEAKTSAKGFNLVQIMASEMVGILEVQRTPNPGGEYRRRSPGRGGT